MTRNMDSFKNIAYQILKEAGNPLHSKKITQIALSHGWLKTAGKTPEATMNAQLIVDTNIKKEKSRFIKTAPSTFGLNPDFKGTVKTKLKIKEEVYKISKDISTKQKGDIAEARIEEDIVQFQVDLTYENDGGQQQRKIEKFIAETEDPLSATLRNWNILRAKEKILMVDTPFRNLRSPLVVIVSGRTASSDKPVDMKYEI